MSDGRDPLERGSNTDAKIVGLIDAKLRRRLAANRNPSSGVWLGLGMMGLVGWSVVVPTLLGAALGMWLDERYPGTHPWTLALLMAGLVLGCANAWRWVAKENRAMSRMATEDDYDVR